MSRPEKPSTWRKDAVSALDYVLRGAADEDFPALSGTISEINQIVASESESTHKLTQVILQDFALTDKLLRLVNTASYGQFGGKINTISKAVVILGFETVRNVAMTLILLEFLQNRSQAAQLKDEVIASFFAGLIAARLSRSRNVRDSEEAMICAMFHRLGRLLCLFYFYEESRQIAGLVAQGMDEGKAAQQVLGISYDDLGQGVARHWCFPERLLAGMKKLPPGVIARPRSELDHLNLTVNLASELCTLAATAAPQDKDPALQRLAQRYSPAGNMDAALLLQALQQGLDEFALRAAALSLPTGQSALLNAVSQWCGHDQADAQVEGSEIAGVLPVEQAVPEGTDSAATDPESLLAAGVQDVSNTLVGDYRLNDVLQMVLETMYRAMHFHHVVLFVRDAGSAQMRARHGFGRDIELLLPRLHFPLQFSADVFHIALQKGVDVVIEDVQAESIHSKLPPWFLRAVDAQCFLLLPIMVREQPLGLLYADMQAAHSLHIPPRQLSLLRTLRNQIVLAIRQKS